MATADSKALRDSRGNITYLLLAELVHGQPALFGVKIRAEKYEDGLQELIRYMNKEGGKRFIDAVDIQAMVRVQLIQCPSCGNVIPANAETCPQCHMNMRSDEMVAAIQRGKIRVIQHVDYVLKGLMDGTSNAYKIRPEHIILYDIVPPDSPAYAKWVEAGEMGRAQMREMRTGLKMPTTDDMAAIKMDELRRKHQGGK